MQASIRALLIAALFAPLVAWSAPYFDVTVPFALKRVPNSNVYYVIGQSGVPGSNNQGFTSNAGFVVTAKGVVVYDALGTPALGYKLLEAIRSVTNKPVAIIVAGHYHADHIYGLQAFKEHTKGQVWAQENAYGYINDPHAEQRLAQRRQALYPWVDEKTVVVKPDHTFRDRHRFDMGDTHLELLYAGPAHSPDDTMMIVEEAGIVFSGDLIFDGRLPFVGTEQVNTKNWVDQLTRLQAMKPGPRFIIPGHGQATADASRAIQVTKNYLLYLRKTMGAAAEDLIPFEEAYEKTDWSKYQNLPTFKATNRVNAYQVYLEMQAAGLQ
jgi:glyoxylase-like metal-dependent hydrolase (beta-lactamase superfamily II)